MHLHLHSLAAQGTPHCGMGAPGALTSTPCGSVTAHRPVPARAPEEALLHGSRRGGGPGSLAARGNSAGRRTGCVAAGSAAVPASNSCTPPPCPPAALGVSGSVTTPEVALLVGRDGSSTMPVVRCGAAAGCRHAVPPSTNGTASPAAPLEADRSLPAGVGASLRASTRASQSAGGEASAARCGTRPRTGNGAATPGGRVRPLRALLGTETAGKGKAAVSSSTPCTQRRPQRTLWV